MRNKVLSTNCGVVEVQYIIFNFFIFIYIVIVAARSNDHVYRCHHHLKYIKYHAEINGFFCISALFVCLKLLKSRIKQTHADLQYMNLQYAYRTKYVLTQNGKGFSYKNRDNIINILCT